MNGSIFKSKLLRAVVLLFIPAISMAQIPDHCYVEGARLVRYYNLESDFSDIRNTHIDYYYDRQGNCRITQPTTVDGYQTTVGDTTYYDNQMRMLSREKDGSLTLNLDKSGKYITTIRTLHLIEFPYVRAEKSDSRGNWTRGHVFLKDNPEMKFGSTIYKHVKREIEYYGEDTAADASLETLLSKVDSQIDNSQTEKTQKSLRAAKSRNNFRNSFFGLLLFGVLGPFLRIFLIFGIPVMIASSIPAIPNWLLKIGALFYGISFLANSFSQLSSAHLFENVVAALMYLGGTYGLYLGLLQKRCPQCHHSNSMVIRTITSKLKKKVYRELPNGERELIDSSTSFNYDDDHHCHNCGYEWGTTRDI